MSDSRDDLPADSSGINVEAESISGGGVPERADRSSKETKRRTRRARPFPALPFEDALTLGMAIQEHAAGQKVRRLTLFENMRKEADSTASRTLIASSNQYGITIGSHAAEYLELTADGAAATSPEAGPTETFNAQVRLAILRNEWFNRLYEKFQNNRLPTTSVLRDTLIQDGMGMDHANECVETFVVNAKSLGLLRTIAGAERLLTVQHALEDLKQEFKPTLPSQPPQVLEGESRVVYETRLPAEIGSGPVTRLVEQTDMSNVCFYIAPIGSDDSEERQHSDLFMGSLVEPALQEFGFRLIRADQITQPGLISKQVIEYIARARLVIADLSFHNPNVFYELALRHAVRKPIVQITRLCDRLPFDVREFRTIQVDTGSIYTLVPRIETYRNEIASQIRVALESDGQSENPLTLFYPGFWSDGSA